MLVACEKLCYSMTSRFEVLFLEVSMFPSCIITSDM